MLKIVPMSSLSGIMVMWTTLSICYFSTVTDTFAAASELSSIQLEREALVNSGWWGNRNANLTSDQCKWVGVTCNTAGSITEIDLTSRKTINKNLGQFNFACFPNLESLRVWNSDLTGNIPSQIGALLKLNFLDLSRNLLTGIIPLEIGNLRNLERLYLSDNNLTGFIPPTLGHLTKLRYLDLSENSLVGSTPLTLGNLTQLTSFELFSNQINASILRKLGICMILVM